MEYTVYTAYDEHAMAAMARVLRQSKKGEKKTPFITAAILVVAVAMWGGKLLGLGETNGMEWMALIASVIVLLVNSMQDMRSGRKSAAEVPPNQRETETIFEEEGSIRVTTAEGTTVWEYSQITDAFETKEYYVFLFDNQYVQIYEKIGFVDGKSMEFRDFIEKKLNMKVRYF